MTILIDNYDSFTYNLYQLLGLFDDVQTIRNDAVTVEELEALQPDRIVLSPGPGRPADAGICEAVIRHFSGRVPILGVCLGHQAICEVAGGTITYARELMHDKQSVVQLAEGEPLFRGLGRETDVGRYHSLAVDTAHFPESLKVLARTQDGEVMAVRYGQAPVYGLQFHPESILTPQGPVMIENFMHMTC